MTKDEAITLAESKWWEHYTPAEAARFQLGEPLLCMPFAEFQRGTEALLGRSVWTHEFADMAGLLAEADGAVAAPTMAEIVAKLAVPR